MEDTARCARAETEVQVMASVNQEAEVLLRGQSRGCWRTASELLVAEGSEGHTWASVLPQERVRFVTDRSSGAG